MTRTADVVDAATNVFLRYGLAKTTMGDIASAARISRPALYLVFPKKDDVFAAVIHNMDATWHAALAASLEKQPTPEAKLRLACAAWTAHGVDMVERYPDAKDLFDMQFSAVREMYEHFEVLIAGFLDEKVAAARLGATPRELARGLIYAMRGIRAAPISIKEMSHLAELQVNMLLAALAPSRAPTRAHPAPRRRAK